MPKSEVVEFHEGVEHSKSPLLGGHVPLMRHRCSHIVAALVMRMADW